MKYAETILTFNVGDGLEHRSGADNGTGIIAINRRTNQTGFVSNEFLIKSKDYDECPESWFFGKTLKDVVDDYLVENNNIHGSFLVRSSINNPGDYVLHVKNYDFSKMRFLFSRVLIRRDPSGFTLNGESYKSLNELIKTLKAQGFHVKNQSTLVRLTNPCLIVRSQMPGSKVIQAWQVHEDDIEMGAFIRAEFPALVFHGKFRGVIEATVKVFGPIGRYQLNAEQKQYLAEEYKHGTQWSINHPNIMQMLGMSYNQDTNIYHVILEGAKFGTLDVFLREQGSTMFNFNFFISFAKDILYALAYLQAKGHVHGNIRARNVYINEQMQAKLTQFRLEGDKTAYEEVDATFKGKFNWSAIEVVERNQISYASDLWSFGILLWEMLTFCEIPFHGISKETMIHLVRDQNYMLPCQSHFTKVHDDILNYVYFQMVVPSWNLEPSKRPKASQLLKRLDKLEKMHTNPEGQDAFMSSESNGSFDQSPLGSGDSGHSMPNIGRGGIGSNKRNESGSDSESDSESDSNSESGSSDEEYVGS